MERTLTATETPRASLSSESILQSDEFSTNANKLVE